MSSSTLTGCVRYDVVPGPDGIWIVLRDGSTLARRASRMAAKTLAIHMAGRETSHKRIKAIVRCESEESVLLAGGERALS